MRRKLAADLAVSRTHAPVDAGARRVRVEDAEALGVLMLEAYRGTIDDGGETLDDARGEVVKTLTGGYGAFDFEASEVIEREGVVVAGTIVTHYEGLPMIAFSLTLPAWRRLGLARGGLLRAMERLTLAGHARVQLAVTRGNTAAERLYESLGFTDASIAAHG
ncbi:MAG: GNAT family N-acetyltransferase [Phycisphaerales bacterium]|nr:GNAT family N-acetyltransferase [Phycisphaerales bacterium]